MKMTLEVQIDYVGNPRRGYHNYDASIQFKYEGSEEYTDEKAESIVKSIIGHPEQWMWYSLRKEEGKHSWKANYGYDSGD